MLKWMRLISSSIFLIFGDRGLRYFRALTDYLVSVVYDSEHIFFWSVPILEQQTFDQTASLGCICSRLAEV